MASPAIPGDLWILSGSYDALYLILAPGPPTALGAPTWYVQNQRNGQVTLVPDTVLDGAVNPNELGPLIIVPSSVGLDFSLYPGFDPIPIGRQVMWSPSYSGAPRLAIMYNSAPSQGSGVLFGYICGRLAAPAGKLVFAAGVVSLGEGEASICGTATFFPFDLVDTGLQVFAGT